MSFDEVRFPTDISYGSAGGPEFSTEVIELGSGHEQRTQNWSYPRERWNVAYGVKTLTQLQALATFFYARAGKARGFRFKNHDDYQGTAEEIGTGDGSETDFQLVKNYTSGPVTQSRIISKPVSGTVQIFIDTVETVSGWTVDTTTGIVSFDTPPSSGEVITATFEFDIPARFDTDHLPLRIENYLARAADVPLLEIRV